MFNAPPAPRVDLVPVVTSAPCRLLMAYGFLWLLLVGKTIGCRAFRRWKKGQCVGYKAVPCGVDDGIPFAETVQPVVRLKHGG